MAGAGLLAFAWTLSQTPRTSFDAAHATPSLADTIHHQSFANDLRDSNLPRYRLSEIKKHDGKSDRPWVMHGDKVYDITDWVAAHPGGQVILRAAGGSIEPYWNIFAIHKSQYVYDILQQYLIGYVHSADLVDGKPAQEQIEDPFADDPERHPSLITRTSKPRNAETPGDAISSQFITPNELFYVRNHMWVPKLTDEEAEDHVLTIELYDGSTKAYTLRDLKTKFPKRSITAALQCSGNRRSDMSKGSGRTANGLPWSTGAISNATWEGVYLADVLADAGFDTSTVIKGTSEVQHVHFTGLEAYGASIPIKKAVDPQGDVLLAYGMNGKTLPRDHGFPLRSVVPGNVAARSVKWLNQITLSEEESTTQWQRKDYKCFGPNETKVDWDAAPSIQELPVQSAITEAKLGDWTTTTTSPTAATSKSNSNSSSNNGSEDNEIPAKQVSLSGYAFSGGGRSIIRVDVSLDGGSNWSQAKLLPDNSSKNGDTPSPPSPNDSHADWSWKLWRFDGAVPIKAFTQPEKQEEAGSDGKTITQDEPKLCTTVVVKATDEVYNTQPESHAATWNVRGNLATAWHRVKLCTDCSPHSVPKSRGGDGDP